MVLVVYALNVLRFLFFLCLFAESKAYSIACFGVDIFMIILPICSAYIAVGHFFAMGVGLYYYQ